MYLVRMVLQDVCNIMAAVECSGLGVISALLLLLLLIALTSYNRRNKSTLPGEL